MAVFDDGTGPALYAGGDFTTAGGVSANNIARWNGTAWSPLGSGVSGSKLGVPQVLALTVFDDGTGPALYAGGFFTTAGGVEANRIAKWDGIAWSPLAANPARGFITSLRALDVDGETLLYVGGRLIDSVPSVAAWDGQEWQLLPQSNGLRGSSSRTMTVFDDGTGPALYAGGQFSSAGGVEASNIARWNGTGWSALGSGMNDWVRALTVFDDGTGPALYAGGTFTTAGGVEASNIARWNGTSWSPVGGGTNGTVWRMAVFDDGKIGRAHV
jgi:hypothetical protein